MTSTERFSLFSFQTNCKQSLMKLVTTPLADSQCCLDRI